MDIALLGKAGSGKDTAASYLCAEHGYTRVAFADPLKELALRVDPYVEPYEHVNALYESEIRAYRLSVVVREHGWERAKRLPEVRRLLQELGAGIRELDEDFWLRSAIEKWWGATGPVVFTDTRYRNEASELRFTGVKLVRIVRPGAGLSGPEADHNSETELDGWPVDHTITNDGSLADLHSAVRALI